MINETLQTLAQKAADVICDLPKFAPAAGPAPKLIAHRGAWGADCVENTMKSFERAQKLGAWGLEFDIHFTKDGVAVVNHDPQLTRGHGHPGFISDLKFYELQTAAPAVPAAEKVLALKNLHFMIEIKTQLSLPHLETLNRLLAQLTPVSDFHLLALDPSLVRVSSAMPEAAWILVGEFNLPKLTTVSLEQKLGGVAGHYLLMTKRLIDDLHQRGQKAGAGFSPTKNLFNREWRRGMDWVFTNHLQDLV